jgi:hypothetical protein
MQEDAGSCYVCLIAVIRFQRFKIKCIVNILNFLFGNGVKFFLNNYHTTIIFYNLIIIINLHNIEMKKNCYKKNNNYNKIIINNWLKLIANK